MFAATAARTHLRRFAASALAHASARCALTTAVPRGAGWSWVSSLACTHHPRTAVAAVTSAHLLGRASEFRGMGFHSSTVMATADVPGSYEDKELSQVLDEELKHETETYEASETIQAGPPEPWVFADDEGSCEIMLTRTYGEDEDIAVVFNVSEVRRAMGRRDDVRRESIDDDASSAEALRIHVGGARPCDRQTKTRKQP